MAVREVHLGAAAATTVLDAWRAQLPGLAWRPPGSGPVRLLGLTAKAPTPRQLGQSLHELDDRHCAFIEDMYGPALASPPALADFRAALRRLRGLLWEKCRNEPLWRLGVHGVAGFPAVAARAGWPGPTGLRAASQCPCGAALIGQG